MKAPRQQPGSITDQDKSAPEPDMLLHARVYGELRHRFITGQIVPGVSLSTRRLATELGVSQTPVREALSRLAAERAVDIRSKRKVGIPPMTSERFQSEEVATPMSTEEPEQAASASASGRPDDG